MNVKRNVAFLLVLAMFASLTACSLGSTASTPTPAESKAAEPTQSQAVGGNDGPVETEDTIVLRYASSDTTANWNEVDGLSNAESDKFMVDEIFKRTNGRYKIEVYPDGQLATGITEQVAGIRNGDFEITSISSGSIASLTDAFSELNVPFMLPSLDTARAMVDSEIGQAMIDQAEADIGLKVMYLKDQAFRQVTTSGKEIVSPADFKGLKLRTQSDPIQMAAFEGLGAAITTVPFSELYTSLQQKVVDGQENPWFTIYSKQFYEVQKYALVTNHIFTTIVMVMSPEVWNAMTPEDQQIFTEVFRECQLYNREIVDKGEVFYKQACTDAGMKIYEPTAEELQAIKDVMVESVYDQCKDTMGEERWNALNDFVSKNS